MENKNLKIDDFWKLDSNKVIYCKNPDESELLLTIFKRMEDCKKHIAQKVGYSYLRYDLTDKNSKQERCFDNLEHDFDLVYYQNHASYDIYELKDIDLSAYLSKKEQKIVSDYFKSSSSENELGN